MLDKNTVRDERVTNIRQEFPTGALMAGAETWWSTLAEYQQEVGQFVSDRLAKDSETIRQGLSCRNWTEALDIQRRWLEETLRDYTDEVKKITGLYAKAASSALREERRQS